MEVSNKETPLDTSVMCDTQNYNIIEYINKAHANISLLELTKIVSQWEPLSYALE